jgi:hypothetical protein
LSLITKTTHGGSMHFQVAIISPGPLEVDPLLNPVRSSTNNLQKNCSLLLIKNEIF